MDARPSGNDYIVATLFKSYLTTNFQINRTILTIYNLYLRLAFLLSFKKQKKNLLRIVKTGYKIHFNPKLFDMY